LFSCVLQFAVLHTKVREQKTEPSRRPTIRVFTHVTPSAIIYSMAARASECTSGLHSSTLRAYRQGGLVSRAQPLGVRTPPPKKKNLDWPPNF